MDTTPTLAPWRSRGYLPHFDEAGAVQALTFRLADSLPRELLFRRLEGLSPEEKARHYQLLDDYLDSGKGACWLARPEIADLMQGTLMHFDSERYRLLAWVVMPNHVHVVIETFADHPVSKVMHSWKGYSASQANKILDRTGQFWMVEYHDRKVRDETHLHNAIRYIEYNPVRARLAAREVDWPYSSARYRGRIPV
ncbi:transposase [bacterium]|nr:transposase [bacterium]